MFEQLVNGGTPALPLHASFPWTGRELSSVQWFLLHQLIWMYAIPVFVRHGPNLVTFTRIAAAVFTWIMPLLLLGANGNVRFYMGIVCFVNTYRGLDLTMHRRAYFLRPGVRRL